MALHSFFERECKHCRENFSVSTGSDDECNRCRTIMTLIAPLCASEVESLLNAVNKSVAAGQWRIRWVDSEDTK